MLRDKEYPFNLIITIESVAAMPIGNFTQLKFE